LATQRHRLPEVPGFKNDLSDPQPDTMTIRQQRILYLYKFLLTNIIGKVECEIIGGRPAPNIAFDVS